ncbi:retrovirus-related pol polyprotein from transposon TNT 1-94 [Tanacetum coccineum]
MFDELLTPPSSVDLPSPKDITPIDELVAPVTAVSTGSHSSTIVDQDAPSPTLFCYYDAFLTVVEPKTYKDALTQSCWIEAMQEELNEFEQQGSISGSWLPSRRGRTEFLKRSFARRCQELEAISIFSAFASSHEQCPSTNEDNLITVYKLKKALYGLKQAPRAWYDMLSSFLISQDFSKGSVDPTLFIYREGKELLLARPIEKHLHAVKRIFRYLRGTMNQGLWYLKDSLIALTAFADADHVGCQDTRRSTSGSMQFLRDRLVSWSSKRQKKRYDIQYGS